MQKKRERETKKNELNNTRLEFRFPVISNIANKDQTKRIIHEIEIHGNRILNESKANKKMNSTNRHKEFSMMCFFFFLQWNKQQNGQKKNSNVKTIWNFERAISLDAFVHIVPTLLQMKRKKIMRAHTFNVLKNQPHEMDTKHIDQRVNKSRKLSGFFPTIDRIWSPFSFVHFFFRKKNSFVAVVQMYFVVFNFDWNIHILS